MKKRNCGSTEKKLLKCDEALALASEGLRRSEEEYRHLVQNSNSIILRMDPKGKIIFLNAFAKRFFGYKDKDVLGRSVIGTIVPPTDDSGHNLKTMIASIMANPRKYTNNENENILRNGERVYIAWTNKAVLDKSRRLKEVLCIGNNITRIRKADEDRFESIVHELREGVISCDLDWKIRYANISAREHLAITGKKKISFLSIIFEKYSVSISRKELRDPAVWHKKFNIVRPETAAFKALYLEAEAIILKDAHGDPASILVLLRDVTEAYKEDKLKHGFLELISHKLRTPMAIINDGAKILKNEKILGTLNAGQMNAVTTIQRRSELVIDLINELLDFVEICKAQTDAARDRIKPCAYLSDIIKPIIKKATNKNTELNIVCGKGVVLNCNKKTFGMVIKNLTENAVKFNDKDLLKIDIKVKKVRQNAVISFSDNGPGVPPEDRDRIFQKFYQVEKYFTGQIEGMGLGLSLAKHLVEMADGRIELKSEIGKGTTFIITIPL